jgi:hypothetical protein
VSNYKTIVFVTSHSWYTIEGYNNKLYTRQLNFNGSRTGRIIVFPTQNHTGATLAVAIKSGLDSAYGSGTYTYTYNERKGAITIANSQSGGTFMILPDEDVSNNFSGT